MQNRGYTTTLGRAAGAALAGVMAIQEAPQARAGSLEDNLCYGGALGTWLDKNEYGPEVESQANGGLKAGCANLWELKLTESRSIMLGATMDFMNTSTYLYTPYYIGQANRDKTNYGPVEDEIGYRLYLGASIRAHRLIQADVFGWQVNISPEAQMMWGDVGEAIFPRGFIKPVHGENPWPSGGSSTKTDMTKVSLGACVGLEGYRFEACGRYTSERWDDFVPYQNNVSLTPEEHVHGVEVEGRYYVGGDSLGASVDKLRREYGMFDVDLEHLGYDSR